jgi:nucleoside-diphosphate-sugar epimerase
VSQLNAKTESGQAKSLVIGGTGLVGGYIVEHLLRVDQRPFALSRSLQDKPGVDWFRGDLENPDTLNFPAFTILYCTADAVLLANALPRLFNPSLRRIVAFSSTSVITKQDTEVAAERDTIRKLLDAERRIAAACEQRNVGWTILRPTLIYAEGRDTNITPLSRLIRRFGFMPLVGGAPGLRQPVHAEDLAIGALAAASSRAAINKVSGRRDARVPGNDRPNFRWNAAATAHHFSAPIAVESRLHSGEAAFSGRQRRDGHSHDERHDFRSDACNSGLRLESTGLQSRVRLDQRLFANRFARQTRAINP